MDIELLFFIFIFEKYASDNFTVACKMFSNFSTDLLSKISFIFFLKKILCMEFMYTGVQVPTGARGGTSDTSYRGAEVTGR